MAAIDLMCRSSGRGVDADRLRQVVKEPWGSLTPVIQHSQDRQFGGSSVRDI